MKNLFLILFLVCVGFTYAQTFPTAFSPNGDGKNDVFAKGYKLRVYNRYGYELFSGNDGWDGTTKHNKKADAGVYFYIIELPENEIVKGSVELFRAKPCR